MHFSSTSDPRTGKGACAGERKEIVARNHGQLELRNISSGAERDNTPILRYVDVKTASGFTPLHFAVAANCLPAVRALLSYDAHIDEFNMFDAGEFWISCATKSTALHVAAASNRLHCAMAILQYYVRLY